jgi:hypothetical protein
MFRVTAEAEMAKRDSNMVNTANADSHYAARKF